MPRRTSQGRTSSSSSSTRLYSSSSARWSNSQGRLQCVRWMLCGCLTSLVVLYGLVLYALIHSQVHPQIPLAGFLPNEKRTVWKTKNNPALQEAQTSAASASSSYATWRQLAVNLAKLPPSETLATLEQDDPFGVRRLAQQLQEFSNRDESSEQHNDLLLAKVKEIFPCPSTTTHHRFSWPDQRNHTKAQAFRNATPGYFIFFQHLRKAGGTNVCTLAMANLPKHNLPSYYCMPDYYWHQDETDQETSKHRNNGCAGCLHRWSNQDIVRKMGNYRIAGNEWDSFDPTRHLQLPALFITSFRRPLDRAVSQFRFECLESRGCRDTHIEPWWEKRRDLYNVYTWTFSDVGRQGRLATSANPVDVQRRAAAVGTALDIIVQFHVVMILEYLPLAAPLIQKVLGFADTSVLTRHVRPHNGKLQRQDSLHPKDFLSPQQYRIMSETLALDEILNDVAQRLFWERLVCEAY